MATPYRYHPLDEARQQIRLMTLFPGSFDDPIFLSIRKKLLTKTQIPDFEALSYAWGDASDRQDVFVQKRTKLAATGTYPSSRRTTLSITSNLSQALRYIRYKEQPRVLWVDAVCVDQQNLDERGKQVTRMPDIYRSAKGVIAWLGPESSTSPLAMKIIVHIGSEITIDFKQLKLNLTSDSYHSFKHFHESLQLDKKAYRAIRELLDRSWFERLWILQELYLGRDRMHMLCGFERTSWEHFCYALEYLQRFNASDPDKIGHRLLGVWFTMIYREYGFSDTLTDLLLRTRYLRCSDPRDKVYALLNLVSKQSSDIQPDYSKSTSETFRSIIEDSLNKGKTLRLLANCVLRERTLSMPSWVPDWSVQSQFQQTIDRRVSHFNTEAHGNIISSDILVAKGVHVTIVHIVTNNVPLEIPRTPNELRELYRKLLSEFDGSVPEMTTQSRIESLCRTLCCNRFGDAFYPPLPQLPSFPKLIEAVMNDFEWLLVNSEEAFRVCSLYAMYANKMTNGRTLVMMSNRLLGLVPEGTRPGDIICVLFGCDVPLVLRPVGGSTFKIVGGCYVDGVMRGEPLLGELPNNWSLVIRWLSDDSTKPVFPAFLDGNTGRVQKEDPRLTDPLPSGWRIKSHYDEAFWDWYVNDLTGEDAGFFDPRLRPTALIEQGRVDIREFRLI